MLTDCAKLALRNIVKRKKRTILTLLGIFVGIAAVVALVSLGQGLQKTINAQFEKVGADKIIIQAKEISFGGQHAPGQLKKQELNIAKKTHGVKEAAGMLMRSAKVNAKKTQRTIFVMSTADKPSETKLLIQFNSWEAEKGRLLTTKDKQKAFIGHNLAHNKLFAENLVIGDKIFVENTIFEIVGINKRTGDPGTDASIVVPEQDLRTILNEKEAYSYIIAQTKTNENPDIVAERIEKTIRKNRHQKEGKENFTVQTLTELIQSFNTVLNIITAVFIGIAAISLIVGGIGIMNVMFTAVLERTKEIGIMKAIGARNTDILLIFIIESGLLGMSGGIIGITTGTILAKIAEIATNATFGQGTITAAFPIWLIIGMLIFATLIGTLSGILPAIRASKQKPADALRYE